MQAFAKRLLSTVLHGSAALAAAGVFLVSEVTKTRRCLLSAITSPCTRPETFDMSKREPLFALGGGGGEDEAAAKEDGKGGAKLAHLWELALLRSVSGEAGRQAGRQGA